MKTYKTFKESLLRSGAITTSFAIGKSLVTVPKSKEEKLEKRNRQKDNIRVRFNVGDNQKDVKME